MNVCENCNLLANKCPCKEVDKFFKGIDTGAEVVLTKEQVEEIRRVSNGPTPNIKSLSTFYGIDVGHVKYIRNRDKTTKFATFRAPKKLSD